MSRFQSVDELLAEARSRLERVEPARAVAELEAGARLVDIRPIWQRAQEGEVADAMVIERNHLEWRLDPASASRVEEARAGQRWVVMCQDGYTSSLAADALNSIGVPATDIIGGFRAWVMAGLPTVPGGTEPAVFDH